MKKQDKRAKKPFRMTPAMSAEIDHRVREEKERREIQARVRQHPRSAKALIDGIFHGMRQHMQPVFGFELEAVYTLPCFPKSLKQVSRLRVEDYRLYRAGSLLFDTVDHYGDDGMLSAAFLDDSSSYVYRFLKHCSVDLGYVLFEEGEYTYDWHLLIKVPPHRQCEVEAYRNAQPMALPRELPLQARTGPLRAI